MGELLILKLFIDKLIFSIYFYNFEKNNGFYKNKKIVT